MSRTPAVRIAGLIATMAIAASACSSDVTSTTNDAAVTTSTTAEVTTTTAEAETTAVTMKLATALEELIADSHLPALGVTVFDGNQIIETAVTGHRRRGDPTRVELADKFSIGSNGKAMTATLVATYVDDGVISWDTTVGDVYGEVLSDLDEDQARLTVRQLLSHTGGIDDEAANPSVIPIIGDIEDLEPSRPPYDGQRRDLAQTTLARPPDHPVGNYMYSNFGYTIVGDMLEEMTGSTWEDLVQSRIFDPLGMDGCGFYQPGTPGQVDQPWGHLDSRGGEAIDPGHADAELPLAIAPAGLVHCSMADWAVFLQSQLRGFQGSSSELISSDAFAALQTPPEGSDYALGWAALQDPDVGLVLTHDGSNNRFMSSASLVPGEDVGFLVVTNLGVGLAAPDVRVVVDAIIDRLMAAG